MPVYPLPFVIPAPFTNGSPIFSFPLPFDEGAWGAPIQGNIRVDITSPSARMVFTNESPFASIEELFDQRPGTPFSADGHRTYTRRFRVMVKDKMMGAAAVCRCPGLPVPFAPYIPYRIQEQDKYAHAVNISASPELGDDFQPWVVTVQYSTEMPLWGPLYGRMKLGWDFVEGVENFPWKIPAWLDWDVESFTQYPMVDLDNKAYTNSADQPFASAPGFQDGFRTLTLSRYERDYETRTERFNHVTNKTEFKGSPPGYALCLGGRGQERYLGSLKYHLVTYRIQLKERIQRGDGTYTSGFDPVEIVDNGMYQRAQLGAAAGGLAAAIPGQLIPIVRFGHAVNHPVLLDGNGMELAHGQKPVVLKFRQYRRVDLNVLLNQQ